MAMPLGSPRWVRTDADSCAMRQEENETSMYKSASDPPSFSTTTIPVVWDSPRRSTIGARTLCMMRMHSLPPVVAVSAVPAASVPSSARMKSAVTRRKRLRSRYWISFMTQGSDPAISNDNPVIPVESNARGLKDRLCLLRRQAGAHAADALSSTPNISARVARLRVNGPPRTKISDTELAHCVGGTVVEKGVVLIEQRGPGTHAHGRHLLERIAGPLALPAMDALKPSQLVFLDTETTGLAGGTGTVVFLLGLARIEGNAFTVRQYLLTAFAGEAPLLDMAGRWLRSAQFLVTFNGKCFDVPLLSARCRLAGVTDVYARCAHIDLLHPTRCAYGRDWGDCRLITAERRLLGFQRQDDIAGAEAPQAWIDYVHRGDARRLPAVVRHNHRDLLSLAALLPALTDTYAQPARHGANIVAIARAHRRAGAETHAAGVLEHGRHQLDTAGLLELARHHRRHRRWEEACGIWQGLATRGEPEAIESLAKYQEHVKRDYKAALESAKQLPTDERSRQRRQRLEAKLREWAKEAASCGIDQ